MPHSAILNVMIKAAYRAGRSLKRDLGEVENLQVSLKGPRNFVTAADRRAEDIVREELAKARPDYGFLGEEGGARTGADKSHRWIVDPLDGTTNFLHGIPHFAVSIALERNGAIVAALTYNPANDELYVAERGKGAFLNDRRIRVAARQRLADAVVACGLPHYGRGDLELGRHEIAAAQQNYAGLRRFGAATLDLAWVAAGRFDAFWERDLSPWDLAAGILLVREAGGFVSDLDGGDAVLSKGSVAAGNDTMHRELLRLIKEAGKTAAKDSSKDATNEASKDASEALAASPAGRVRP
jgi:myo-inositol-1(or 4)-monophosphatase